MKAKESNLIKDKPNRRNLIFVGPITVLTILATLIQSTIGFFTYKLWEWIWPNHKKDEE